MSIPYFSLFLMISKPNSQDKLDNVRNSKQTEYEVPAWNPSGDEL